MILCESWLNDSISDDRLNLPNYHPPFRCDRVNRQGGGVCCYVRDSIRCKRVFHPVHPLTESIWLELPDSKLILHAIYVPPGLKTIYHKEIIDNIIDCADKSLKHFPDGRLLIAGDTNNLLTTDIETSLDVIQVVNTPTRKTSILDKILMSKTLMTCYFGDCLKTNSDLSDVLHVGAPIGNSDHCTVMLRSRVKQDEMLHPKVKTLYDFRSSNIANFLKEIQLVDWAPIYDENFDFEERCYYFHDILLFAFNKTIPVAHVTLFQSDKPWMTPLLKLLINERWKAYREKDFSKFRHYKMKCAKEIEKAKKIWAKKQSKKNIWNVVKSVRGTGTSDFSAKLLQQFPSLQEASNEINDTFLSHTQASDPVDVGALDESSTKSFPPFSVFEVFMELHHLNTNKSFYDIPIRMYKSAAHIIAEPLCCLINWSLSNGIVPTAWKCAKVIPIPKSSSMKPDELRPISILPTAVKVMEKLLLKRIQRKTLNCIGPNQFGFRPSSSTTCALIALHDFYTGCLERSDVTGFQVTAYDFSKAFDRLKHDIVLKRLLSCNFPRGVIHWIKSYLENRTQFVQIGMTKSESKLVASGVPQGSIIGPFLFSLTTGSFILNKETCKECKLIMYADDFTICAPLFKHSVNQHISNAHESLLCWSKENSFLLNVKKCKTMVIPRTTDCAPVHLKDIPYVKELRLLGVMFNTKGTWTHHIDNIVKRASRNLYIIRVLRLSLSKDQLIRIYNATIRTILEYSSPLFVGLSKKDSLRLERVQRRFHRILCGSHCEEHSLPTLAVRREHAAIKLFEKTQYVEHILNDLSPLASSSGRFLLPYMKTKRRLNSFFFYVARVLNECHKR